MVKAKFMGISTEYPIPTGESILGRKFKESAANIQIQELNMEGVSRYHCNIYNNDGIIEVKDAGSKNGTCINEIKIEPHRSYELANKDILTLGNCTLELKIKNQLFG